MRHLPFRTRCLLCFGGFLISGLASRTFAFVSADALDSQAIVVMWSDAHSDETGYRIERALKSGGPFTLVDHAPADSDVWTDTGLLADTTYHYRVVPVSPDGSNVMLGVATATTLPTGDSTARMRQNALNYWRAVGASRKSPRMITALVTLTATARSALTTQQENGSWPDINYDDFEPGSNWTPRHHYERLQQMARGWATPGTALYRNPALLDAFLRGVDFIETHINSATSLAGGNWWWWQIGAPERYGPALVLMRDQLGITRLSAAAKTLDYLIGTEPRHGADGIQNHVWVGTNRLYHGMLTNNAASILDGATRLANQVAFARTGGEGIMPDFSFQAHGKSISGHWLSQLATGHYGAAYMAYLPRFSFFAEGTSFQLNGDKQRLLADFALKGARWVVWNQFRDISSEGRSYTRAGANSVEILSGLLALANSPGSPAQPAAAATTKALLQSWTRPMLPEDAGFAARIEASPITPALPAGLALYPNSDYAVYRAAGFMVSVKNASTRSLIGELVNNENKRGRHLASGATWIMTGDEYRATPVIPTLDHSRIPGTTVEKGVRLTASETWHYQPGLRSFVGGVTSGNEGVVAMDFQSRASKGDSHLTAKKSWFFLNDSFVAIGSGISSTLARTVETIVNQRPLPTLAADITFNGSLLPAAATDSTTLTDACWVHAADIGYVFPGPATVKIKRQNHTGKWSDIGAGDSTTTHITPMFTLWFDHGEMPVRAGYAYAVLPGKTAAQTREIAAAAPFQILAQTDALHAVKHSTRNALGAVFWEPGTIEKLTVDTPCVVFLRQNESTLQVSIAEPTHAAQTIRMTYAARLLPVSLPPDATITTSDERTEVAFHVEAGRSYSATFELSPSSAK